MASRRAGARRRRRPGAGAAALAVALLAVSTGAGCGGGGEEPESSAPPGGAPELETGAPAPSGSGDAGRAEAGRPAGPGPGGGRVVLVALDGGSLRLLRSRVAAGELPNAGRLLREGASGRLPSLYRELPFSPERGGGFWSPVVWTSIATGQPPEVHGVVDFRLPESAVLCTREGAESVRILLPRVAGAVAVRLELRAPAPTWSAEGPGGPPRALGAAAIELPMDAAEPAAGVGEAAAPAARHALVPGEGKPPPPDRLALRRPPPGPGPGDLELLLRASATGSPPLCFTGVELVGPRGEPRRVLDPGADRARFAEGFGDAVLGRLRPASVGLRRVPALWDVAGAAGLRVAVVAWRDGWPAERVRGVFVSDRLGLRLPSRPGRVRAEASDVWPPELLPRVRELLDGLPAIDADLRRRLDPGPCALPERDLTLARFQLSQDRVAQELALALHAAEPAPAFTAVYLRGLDALGHMFPPDREERAPGCPPSPPLLHRAFAFVDELLGAWMERLDGRTTLVVATDHGMATSGPKGEHADDGFLLLAGRGIRRGGTVRDADVLDVAPLVLHLLGLPLAEDMPGSPPWSALDPDWLREHPPRVVPTHAAGFRGAGGPDKAAIRSRPAPPAPADAPEVEAEILRRLRALGYLPDREP